MATHNDINTRAREIEELVGANRIADAIKRLMDFVTDFSENREWYRGVILASRRHVAIEREARSGTIEFDVAERHRNQLLNQVLDLIDFVREQPLAA